MTSLNLSHFCISKKPLLVFQSSANLTNFRQPTPIGQNFERLVMVFLKYNNGSNLERSLLSIIQSFVANPSKMKIFLIRLMLIIGRLMDENKKFLFSKNKYCFYFHIHQLDHKYALNLKFFGTKKIKSC